MIKSRRRRGVCFTRFAPRNILNIRTGRVRAAFGKIYTDDGVQDLDLPAIAAGDAKT